VWYTLAHWLDGVALIAVSNIGNVTATSFKRAYISWQLGCRQCRAEM